MSRALAEATAEMNMYRHERIKKGGNSVRGEEIPRDRARPEQTRLWKITATDEREEEEKEEEQGEDKEEEVWMFVFTLRVSVCANRS